MRVRAGDEGAATGRPRAPSREGDDDDRVCSAHDPGRGDRLHRRGERGRRHVPIDLDLRLPREPDARAEHDPVLAIAPEPGEERLDPRQRRWERRAREQEHAMVLEPARVDDDPRRTLRGADVLPLRDPLLLLEELVGRRGVVAPRVRRGRHARARLAAAEEGERREDEPPAVEHGRH
jgi:hypothetical protein